MPKVNKSLVVSIIADIKEIVSVANEMLSWLDSRDYLSWKYPTRKAKNIKAVELVENHEGSAGELYIFLLELAYDRVHFIFRLMLDFVDKFLFTDDPFKESTNVRRPSYMSLANIVRLIWNRLVTLPTSISQSLVKRKDPNICNEKVTTGSQSEVSNVNHCESCSLAGASILEMINMIENILAENKLISAAATEREHSKGDIYEKTQWAVMSRLVAAIRLDVKTICTMRRERDSKWEATRRNYENTIESLRCDLSRRIAEHDALQAKNTKLTRRIENVSTDLEKSQSTTMVVEEKNKKLLKDLEKTRRKISSIAEGNKILQGQVGTLVESKLELENTVSRLCKETLETKDACTETERRFRLLVTELQVENETIKVELNGKIKDLEAEIAELQKTAKDRPDPVDKADKSVGHEDENIEPEKILMPGDDPILDMTRQLISNQEKIEILSRQNERLSKTLQRLQEYRRAQ